MLKLGTPNDVHRCTSRYAGVRPISKFKQVSTFLSTFNICTNYHSRQYSILRNVEIEVVNQAYARVHISSKGYLGILELVLKFEHLSNET